MPGKSAAPPSRARIAAPRQEDFGQVFGGDLTPDRIRTLLTSAARGDPGQLAVLFDEMLSRDEDLRNVHRTRMAAVTGLEWEIVSPDQIRNASGRISEAAAKPPTEYCREVLEDLDDVDGALSHLLLGIGRGISVCEVVWDQAGSGRSKGHRPVEIHPVMHTQLHYDAQRPDQLRIRTDGNPEGVMISESPAGTFVTHAPDPIAGNGFRGALLLVATIGYLEKRWGRRWEMIFLELFGMPLLTAKYGPEVTDEDKTRMLEMIRDQGVARGGIFPSGAEIELHESGIGSGQSGLPHEIVIARVNAAWAKLWLGQTLTTEIGQTGGARAAAQVHDLVRGDIRDDDLRSEARTIRRDLLSPMVRNKFGPDAPVPYFRRVYEAPRDTTADLANIATAVNQLGLKVRTGWVAEQAKLQLVVGTDMEAAVPGMHGGDGDVRGDAIAGDDVASQSRKRISLAAHRQLDDIARRGSSLGKMAGWIVAAALASQAHTETVAAAIMRRVEESRIEQAEQASSMGRWIEELPIDDMRELQRQMLLTAELAGRDRVRRQIDARRESQASLSAHADDDELIAQQIDFENLPFAEAIEAFRIRIGLDPQTFITLDREARSRAWRIAGVWNMDLLASCFKALTLNFESGGTARDFRLAVPQMLDREGWTGETPWHADLVHMQNFAMATAAGRRRQYEEAEIGHWKFTAWGATCPICAPFVGKTFKIGDRRAWPPLHFGCDCEDEVVFDEEVGAVDDSARIPAPEFEAEQAKPKAFKWDVAEYGARVPIRMSRYPEQLQPAFRAMAEARGWEIE